MAVPINKAKLCVWVLGALGIAILLIGIIALSLFPSIYKKKVQENVQLTEGKETFEKWKKTPIPVSFTIYLFNVTNPIEVEEKGKKPVLQEVGPFFFKQMRSKEVLSRDEENHTVTYRDKKTFHFVPEESADPEEKIYTLNIPLMGVLERLGKSDNNAVKTLGIPIVLELLKEFKERLFVHRTPSEMLFQGYKVKILEKIISSFKRFYAIPEVLPNNTFGFFYGRNNSGNGIFTVNTGVDDIKKYSQIISWNGANSLDFWQDKYCGMINGTDGGQFAPPVTRYETLYVFTPEICRSVYLDYVKDVYVQDILTYRFMAPENMFGKDNPHNKCFCSRPEFCNVSGVMDVSKCMKGASIFVSAPHFYKGDEFYTDDVEGLYPVQDLHESYVDIEPTVGVVLRAARKMQLNFLVENNDLFPQTAKIPKTLFPLLWLIEGAQIDPVMASAFTSKVKSPVTVAKSVLTACIVIGILWIVLAGIVTVYIVYKKKQAPEKPSKSSYQSVPMQPTENGEKYKPVDT